MKYLYGSIPDSQVKEIQKSIRGSIFFLLLCVDPKTADSYPDVDVNKIFENLLDKLDGYNTLLLYPLAIAETMSLLQAAQNLYNSPMFKYWKYRKLILDAGMAILKIEEV